MQQMPVRVDERDTHGCMFEHQPETFLTVAQICLNTLLHRDVPKVDRKTAMRRWVGGGHEPGFQALAKVLDTLGALLCARPFEGGLNGSTNGFGVHVPADTAKGFFCGTPQQTLCRWVDVRVAPVSIHGDEAVGDAAEYRLGIGRDVSPE